MANGTPATALLDRLGLPYRLHPYPHDPRRTSFGDEAVESLGVEPGRFFKTLLAEIELSGGGAAAPHRLACGVVPVAGKLGLKAFARALRAKRAELAPVPVAERSSGYVRGGISPLAQRTTLTCLVDESAILHPTVYVSAGLRGLALEIAPDDLLLAVPARYAAIAETAD